jgi:3-oxoacyl-[acyl-carrier-protein] synthase-3
MNLMPSPDAVSPQVVSAIAGSAAAFGSLTLPSENIDEAFSMEIGKLRKRAGLLTVSRAAPGETELTLAAAAARAAIDHAAIKTENLDWILATSETHRSFPSLAAELHASLNLRDSCGALDVGGACLGVLQALAVAQALLANGSAKTVLVASADLHSRTLVPGKVRGEFGGLFGDGASAFVLQNVPSREAAISYRLGGFFFGCAGQYARAIQLRNLPEGDISVVFDGDALSRAAIAKMAQIIRETESRSGFSRNDAFGFATHQPNPRLVSLLAKQMGVSVALFPRIAELHGNLGASTCGAALHELLYAASRPEAGGAKPIFLASLGPGLLFGGGWLAR